MDDKKLLISLYDGCQYHCTFCMYGYVKDAHPLGDKDSMGPQEWYDTLSAAHARGFRTLEIGGRGEPTLNPVFTKVIRIAHDLGFRIQLLSNALNDKAIIEILPFISQLTINLNAVDEQGMKDIHQPSPGFTFERCIAAVRNVLRGVAEKNFAIKLRTNYVVTTQSIKAAFSFPQEVNRLFAAELDARKLYVHYQHVHNYIKTPKYLGFDFEGLKKVLMLARLNGRKPFLLEHSNLNDFIRQTEKLIRDLEPFSGGQSPDCQHTCEVHKYLLFIDGNGDCYGCYNPFRAVNGLPIEKDPFFFGNLKSKTFDEIFKERNGFHPVMDVSKPYWRPCLLCRAVKVPVTAS